MSDELAYRDPVVARVGQVEYRGTVREICGRHERRQVVVDLTPEVSGYIVAEPTTAVFPIEELHLVEAA